MLLFKNLSGSFHAFCEAQEDDDPSEKETQSHVPQNLTRISQTVALINSQYSVTVIKIYEYQTLSKTKVSQSVHMCTVGCIEIILLCTEILMSITNVF